MKTYLYCLEFATCSDSYEAIFNVFLEFKFPHISDGQKHWRITDSPCFDKHIDKLSSVIKHITLC